MKGGVQVTVHPLTPDRWPDFERLFGACGVGGGCWCMGWRLPTRKRYLEQKGEANKKAMRALVEAGVVPGLLAYDGEEPIGWCSLGPREAFPGLERAPSRRPVDGERVWSVTCVYVARKYRRRRLSSVLLEAAVRHVVSRGGRIVEGYPVPPKTGVSSTNYAFTGFVQAFERAGFKECARRTPTRPVVRRYL